jgi:hypothetical protein
MNGTNSVKNMFWNNQHNENVRQSGRFGYLQDSNFYAANAVPFLVEYRNKQHKLTIRDPLVVLPEHTEQLYFMFF